MNLSKERIEIARPEEPSYGGGRQVGCVDSRWRTTLSLRRPWLLTALLALGLGVLQFPWGWLGWVEPGWAAPQPRSLLDRPLERGAIFLVGTASVGGTKDYDSFQHGYGLTLLFRPLAAADFLGPLYDWNTALVLQAEYRPVASKRRLLAGDLILRRYWRDMRRQARGASFFVGFGAGGAEITFPTSGGASGSDTWYSLIAELGYEHSPRDNWVFVVKGQWRNYQNNNRDYSGWSAHLGIGVPIPW